MSNRGLAEPVDRRRDHYGCFGRRVPPPGNGMPARASRLRWARGSRDRESALREASAGRRSMSYHDTWPMGSDQSRPVFDAAGC